MRKYLILFILFILWNHPKCQLIESLNLPSSIEFSKIEGDFIKKQFSQDGKNYECYEFSSAIVDLSYYPLQSNIDCGYFLLNENKFELRLYLNQIACDLDYASFEVFMLEMKTDSFILVNSIGNVSGTATRRVFINLFKISGTEIKYFPLTSLYGFEKNFGDFNKDGQLDYIETFYDKVDPYYKIIFSTLQNDQFTKDEKKFIRFKKIINSGTIKTKIIEKKW